MNNSARRHYKLHGKKTFPGTTKVYFTHFGMRKTPSFNGTHNAVRMKVLMVLADHYKRHRYKGVTLQEIAHLTGCNYFTLKRHLIKWCRWHFMNYRLSKGGRDRLYRHYYILARGRDYLETWDDIIPFARYRREMKQAVRAS